MINEEDVFDFDYLIDEFETDEELIGSEEDDDYVYNYDIMVEEYNEFIGYREEGCWVSLVLIIFLSSQFHSEVSVQTIATGINKEHCTQLGESLSSQITSINPDAKVRYICG